MVIIRQMELSDLPDVDTIQKASFIPALWEDMALFHKILTNFNHSSFVAVDSGVMLGYLLTYPSAQNRDDFEEGWRDLKGTEDTLYIHDLCVHPDERGKGLAGNLFRQCEDYARQNGFTRLGAIAVQDAELFWARLGFKIQTPYLYHGEPGVLMIKALA